MDSRTILDQMGAETLLGPRRHAVPAVGHLDADARARRVRVATRKCIAWSRRCKKSGAAELHRGGAVGPEHADSGHLGRGRRGRRRRRCGEQDALYDEAVKIVTTRAQALDLLRAAAPEDRLQPRRAAARERWKRRASSARCSPTARAKCSRRAPPGSDDCMRERRGRWHRPRCVCRAGLLAAAACAAAAAAQRGSTPLDHVSRRTSTTLRAEFTQTVDRRAAASEVDSAQRHAGRRAARQVPLGAAPPSAGASRRRSCWSPTARTSGSTIATCEQVTVKPADAALTATPAMLLSGARRRARVLHGARRRAQREGLDWVLVEPQRGDADFRERAARLHAAANSQRMVHRGQARADRAPRLQRSVARNAPRRPTPR